MFRFRLATLLRLRLAERDERRAELAKAIRAEELLRQQVLRLTADQSELTERARCLKSPGGANIDALLQTHRYELVLAASARQLAGQITQVAAEVERRRQLLVAADRQVQVLEKLRESQAAKHRLHEERAEAKQLDEAALLGYARKEAVR